MKKTMTEIRDVEAKKYVIAFNDDGPGEAFLYNEAPKGGFCGLLITVISYSEYQTLLTEMDRTNEALELALEGLAQAVESFPQDLQHQTKAFKALAEIRKLRGEK